MKICFWGNIANSINGNTEGGGELQIAILAEALARVGHEVVVLDTNTTENFITKDGIKVFKIVGWNSGIRYIRTFTHRLPKLYLSLKAQKADIYYCRIRDFRHILAFYAAHKVNAKLIIGLASDLDVMNFAKRFKFYYLEHKVDFWHIFSSILNEIIYPWLFRNADLILAQHIGQKDILLKKRIESLVFPNLFNSIVPQIKKTNLTEYFIYVGSLHKRKGFFEFYDLVKKTPTHKYIVIGQPMDKMSFKYYEELKSFDNVSLLGRLSHSETLKHIANSKAMISTSRMEGFPNIFIEAWACGVPVISLHVDPGEIIQSEKLGEVCFGNLDKMLEAMDNIINTDKISKRTKFYVEHNHELNNNKLKEINMLFSKIHNSVSDKQLTKNL